MKIKLTESQYSRLLVENDKSFLDGDVQFPNIGNKVSKFIVKLFNYIYKKIGSYEVHKSQDIGMIMTRDFGLTVPESKLLIHNYSNFSKNTEVSEFNEFLGLPLEFYGEFKYTTGVPVSAYVNGRMEGFVYGNASSYEEFIDSMKNGNWDLTMDSDWEGSVESWPEDAEWEIDQDWGIERLSDEIGDETNIETLKDKIVMSQNEN